MAVLGALVGLLVYFCAGNCGIPGRSPCRTPVGFVRVVVWLRPAADFGPLRYLTYLGNAAP